MKSLGPRWKTIALLTTLLATSCFGSPIRFANVASCLGYFDGSRHATGFRHVPGYEFETQWNVSDNRFYVVSNKLGALRIDLENGQIIPLSETVVIPDGKRNRVTDLTDDTITIANGIDENASSLIHYVGNMPNDWIEHSFALTFSKFNAHDSIVAGLPGGISNQLVAFEVTDELLEYGQVSLDLAVANVWGWSNDGTLFAASEYSRDGEVLRYVDFANDTVYESAFNLHASCVRDVIWVSDDSTVIFSGENAETSGWDLVMESALTGNVQWITQTPEEDELYPALSENQQDLAYVKRFVNADGNAVQELFLLDFEADSATPVQLTTTENEYEFAPTWVSEDRLAYLVWIESPYSWEVRTISISDPSDNAAVKLDVRR